MNGPFAIILRRSGGGWEVVGLYKPRKYPNARYSARSTCWERSRGNAASAARIMALR